MSAAGVLADSMWTVASALARSTRGSACRSLVMPAGSRRQRLARAVMRYLMEAACMRGGVPLAQVLARVEASKGAVIFLPSIGWSAKLFQRPHHLARAFARRGYVAIFDSTNVVDDIRGFVEIEPNLFLFRGPASRLRRVPNPVLWTLPYNYHEAIGYPAPSTVVYDWIDDLGVFTDHDPGLLRRNHERALAEADVVTSVARTLHARALARRAEAVYVPNAVEDEAFAAADVPVPDDPALRRLRREGKPIAGYYGALARWFDYDLVEETARRRPDWNFLLIGPEYDGSLRRASLLTLPNVTWVGPRPYPALPGYLRLFDVAIIPFRLGPITMATSPLKLYEYFAGGRPVITTAIPECIAHPEVEVVTSAEDFAASLDVARSKGRDPAMRTRLRALAAANSWTERVREIERVMGARARSKAPVGQRTESSTSSNSE
jgi:glycosyltransferase involved in cell wall biosynthesis